MGHFLFAIAVMAIVAMICLAHHNAKVRFNKASKKAKTLRSSYSRFKNAAANCSNRQVRSCLDNARGHLHAAECAVNIIKDDFFPGEADYIINNISRPVRRGNAAIRKGWSLLSPQMKA